MQSEVEMARLEMALLMMNTHLGEDSIGDTLEGLRAALGEEGGFFAPDADASFVRWYVGLGEDSHAVMVQKLDKKLFVVSRIATGSC
jgi:hypothetical protein